MARRVLLTRTIGIWISLVKYEAAEHLFILTENVANSSFLNGPFGFGKCRIGGISQRKFIATEIRIGSILYPTRRRLPVKLHERSQMFPPGPDRYALPGTEHYRLEK